MTGTQRDAEVGRVASNYESLIRRRACLRIRLARHGKRLSEVVHALEHWDTSGHTKEAVDLLDAERMDAVRRDVSAMAETDTNIEEAELNMREVGLANLVRGS